MGKRYLTFFLILISSLGAKLYGQYIRGPGSNLCPNTNYTYTHDIYEAGVTQIQWSISPPEAGTVVDSDEDWAIISWTKGYSGGVINTEFTDGSSTYPGFGHLSVSVRNLSLLSLYGSDYVCGSNWIYVGVTSTSVADDEKEYTWRIIKSGYQIYAETSNSANLYYQVPDDLRGYIIVQVTGRDIVCDQYTNTLYKGITIYNDDFDQINFTPYAPLCQGEPASQLEIQNIPNPKSTVNYSETSYSDKDSIDFEFTKYVFVDNPDDVCPGDDIYYLGQYACPSGFVANYTVEYDSPDIILDTTDIKLVDANDPTNIIYGLRDGIYTVNISNPLFCDYQNKFKVNAPDPLIFQTATPVIINETPVYHITTPKGRDGMVKLELSGRDSMDYYYYFDDINNKQLVSYDSEKDENYIDGVSFGTNILNITDINNCSALGNGKEITLNDPDSLVIDTMATNRILCNENDSVYSIDDRSSGLVSFEYSGGIGPYFVKMMKDGVLIDSSDFVSSGSSYFEDLSKGNYRLIIRDNDSSEEGSSSIDPYQTDIFDFEIKQPTPITISFSDIIAPVCSPISDGKIVVSASGGSADFDKLILLDETKTIEKYVEGDDDNDTLRNIGADSTYYIKAKNENGCYQYEEFISGDYSSLLNVEVVSSIPEVCLGGSDGSILLHGYGGHKGDQYSSTYYDLPPGVQESESFVDSTTSLVRLENVYSDSLYWIKLEDDEGCIVEDTVWVTGYSSPLKVEVISSTPEVCLGGSDGSILLHGYGGHKGDEYNSIYYNFPSGVQESEAFVDNTPSLVALENVYSDSLYWIRLEDNEGCLAEDTVWVTGYSSPLGFDKISRVPPNCIEGDDGYVKLQGVGGHEYGNYDHTYFSLQDYTDASFSSESYETTISNLRGDSIYTITINDNSGCIVTDTLYLGEEPNPVVPLLLDSAEERCFEYNDGWIKVSGTSGEKPAGGYYYYLTDEDNFSLDPIEPTDTSWAKSGDEATFYNIPPGTHNIYIADENDCLNNTINADRNVYKAEFYVEAQDLIQYDFEVHNSSTIGGQDGHVKVVIWGGNEKYDYQIIDKLSNIVIESGKVNNDTSDLGALKEGEYSLHFKDTCGCANGGLEWMSYDFNIIDPADSLDLDIIRTTEPSCHGYSDGSVELIGQDGWGDYEYGVDSIYNNTDGILTGLPSGYHNVCVKDKEGAQYCTEVYIDQPDTVVPAVEEITDVQCYNGSDGMVTLSATGGTMPYYYSSDNTNWQSDSTLIGFSKGEYNLFIKDAHDCQVSILAEVNHPDDFTLDYEVKNTICGESQGSVECTINGGTLPYSYEWYMVDTDGEHFMEDQATAMADNLAGGKYKLYLTDAHLCDTSWVFIVNNTDGPELTIKGIESVSCSGMSDGEITYFIEQGIAPYYVELQSGAEVIHSITHESAGNYSFNNLTEGSYSIMVRDANPCVQSSDDLEIKVPNPLEILLDTLNNPVCYGDANGQLSVHAVGGNGDYIYQWNNGGTSSTVQGISAGTYHVTATDSKGCYSEGGYELIDPEKLTVNIGDDETICEGQVHELTVEDFTTQNWFYNGENISSAEEIEVWSAGEYVVVITDQDGCLATDTFELSISNDLLEAEFLMPSEANENDTIVAIDISWPEPENISWDFSSGIISIDSEKYIEVFTFESPGTYTVSMTSYKAMCVDSVSKQIVVYADTSGTNEKSLLGDDSLIKDFKVYPNPNNGEFSVEVELGHSADIQVDLYSVQQNRLIFRQKGNGQSYYNMEYGFTSLQPGVYLVILHVENEKRTERILIF